MEVRIIGPAEELGEVNTLTVFGNEVRREKWTKVDVTPEQATKLQNNRYFEVRNVKASDKDANAQAEQEQSEVELDGIRARLVELGVTIPKNANEAKLNQLLDKAEADKAEADAKAAEEAAAAEAVTGPQA